MIVPLRLSSADSVICQMKRSTSTVKKSTVARLTQADRRSQLLDVAIKIVHDSGTDALSLGTVAERAGVSKPVVYEHFGTRSGLLVALYRQIDARQVQVLLDALTQAPKRLKEVARVVGEAYMNCYITVGPEWHAISAALKGDDQMEATQQELVDGYVGIYRNALAPFSKLSDDNLRLRCIGIYGAGEAISREMIRGRTNAATAAANLTALIVNAISRD